MNNYELHFLDYWISGGGNKLDKIVKYFSAKLLSCSTDALKEEFRPLVADKRQFKNQGESIPAARFGQFEVSGFQHTKQKNRFEIEESTIKKLCNWNPDKRSLFLRRNNLNIEIV